MKVVVRPYKSSDLRSVVTKLRTFAFAEHYTEDPGAFDVEWNSSVWRWLETHPLADDMHRWVLDHDGQAVGFLAAVPQFYRIDGRRVVAHTPAEYMVFPGYGFYALSLMRKLFRTCENYVACNLPETSIKVEKRLGAEETGSLRYAVKLLDTSLLERFPAPVSRSLNLGLRAADRTLIFGLGGSLKVEELSGFDASFDDLFERTAAALPCLPEKGTSFLRWRYEEGPQWPVTILGVRDEGDLLGYAVLRVAVNGVKGYLLDLTTLPGRHDVARALLRAVVRRFVQEGVRVVVYRFMESSISPRARDLWRLGFFFRNQKAHKLLVKFADRGLQRVARNPANWSYNVGDGEPTFWVR